MKPEGAFFAMGEYLFTSESVSEGHPDKICDRISDSILDLYLEQDSASRVAVECMATTNRVLLAGEVRSHAQISAEQVCARAQEVVKALGYEQEGFHWRNLRIENFIHEQSADIAHGIGEEGAGDQGLMFGYACDETIELMPAALYYSHKILRRLSEQRVAGRYSELGPDAKSQLSLIYDEESRLPLRCHSIVVSTQHGREVPLSRVQEIVREVAGEVLPDGWLCADKNFHINPTGQFVIGGPDGDAGLTGRKIIVDTYGGAAPHGGGAFSGKDASKVDRSAAYAARYLAKNIVAAKLARRCLIQIAYAIGVAEPVAFYVDLQERTTKASNAEVAAVLQKMMNLTPRGIREHLALTRPIFEPSSNFGHFGRKPREDGSFSWEKCDLAEKLKDALA